MPKRDYASKLYAQKGDALKLYASKGICLMTVCPKGTMPYDCMPKGDMPNNCMPKGDMPFDWMPIYCPAIILYTFGVSPYFWSLESGHPGIHESLGFCLWWQFSMCRVFFPLSLSQGTWFSIQNSRLKMEWEKYSKTWYCLKKRPYPEKFQSSR